MEQRIRTERLDLVAATIELLRAELADRAEFARLLGARVPDGWPPDLYDADAIAYSLGALEAGAPVEWGTRYIVRRPRGGEEPVLIGVGGFKGQPDDGVVEIGYSVLEDFQRQGYASEAARGFVAFAFSHPDVTRVVAETLPELTASIRVLENCGFSVAGPGSEEGTIRYELRREDHRD